MSVGFKILCSLGYLMFQNVYLCRLLHPKSQLIGLKLWPYVLYCHLVEV